MIDRTTFVLLDRDRTVSNIESTRDLREIIREPPRERDLKRPYGGGPIPRRRSVAARARADIYNNVN